MSRGFSECCHYDEGYEDGYADGEREANPHVGETVPEFLRLYARLTYDRIDLDAGDRIRALADEFESDPSFHNYWEAHLEKAGEVVKAYKEAKAAA